MSAKSERKKIRKEQVATYYRSNPPEGYDAIYKRVNVEITALGEGATFADLAGIDKKLGRPKATSSECGAFADYFEFMSDN